MASTVSSDQQFIWQRQPITITLEVGQEQLLAFPEKVTLGYPENRLPPSRLRVENVHHTLYLLAKQPFSMQRVEAKLTDGNVVLLNLQAVTTHQPHRPIDIELPAPKTAVQTKREASRIAAVTLIRYALQQLYAPKRLLKSSYTIHRFPMTTHHLISLVNSGTLLAMPLASWKGEGLYITAVEVSNLMPYPLTLQPQQFCGKWKTVSFFPRQKLSAHGDLHQQDRSTLFLLSTQPFAKARTGCEPVGENHS